MKNESTHKIVKYVFFSISSGSDLSKFCATFCGIFRIHCMRWFIHKYIIINIIIMHVTLALVLTYYLAEFFSSFKMKSSKVASSCCTMTEGTMLQTDHKTNLKIQ